MAEKSDIWSKKRPVSSINPQGLTEETADHRPKSQLEDRAKKRNTKV